MMCYLLFIAVLLLSGPTFALGSNSGDEAIESAGAEKEPLVEIDPESAVEGPVGEGCPDGVVCVPHSDMEILVQILRERQCLETIPPSLRLDEITIVLDEDGRVFYDGAGPELPYTVTLDWCHYSATGTGTLQLVAAVDEPPVWGFRFRPKAYVSYLFLTPFFDGNEFGDGVDAGFMVDFFHFKSLNFNVQLGFRSFGAAVGLDVTRNFGAFVGPGVSWEGLARGKQPLVDLNMGIFFSF